MPKALLLALACAVLIATVSFAGAREHRYGLTELVGIECAAIDSRLAQVRAAIEAGQLKLALRGDRFFYFYAGPESEDLLNSLGLGHRILMQNVGSRELYLIPRGEGHATLPAEYVSRVVSEEEAFYLVAVEGSEAAGIHMLPLKKRLPLPLEPGLPLMASQTDARLSQSPASQPQEPLAYDPEIQAMVDSVSESVLYTTLSGLSGENPVVVGGETVIINTRYSPEPMCKVAGQFIKERFEAMGIEAEYDYFRFLTQVKRVVFPLDNHSGWAVGKSGLLLHTDDGGVIWDEQDWGGSNVLWDIVMLDNSHGCIVGNAGVALTTDDGGANWQAVSTPTSKGLYGLYFIDASTAFSCGEDGIILESVDGGSSWSSVSSGTSQDLNSIW
jgi:hypothetical protein